MSKLTIEVWSDVACPWCWVGKRHLDQALAQFPHPTTVVWRAFELDPRAGKHDPHGPGYVERLARKYGAPRATAQGMIDQMTARGAQLGLEFRFDRTLPANTFNAHRLLHLAGTHPWPLQHQLKERLFRAHFHEGHAIDDVNVLVELAAEVGLDAQKAQRVLESDTYANEVRTEEAAAHQLGITGVPFFVLAGRFGVSGAQPVDALLQALTRAWEDSDPAPDPSTGEVCGPDGCVLPVAVTT